MKHGFFAAERPLVFAHRGGAALAPENTLKAFEQGLRLGADGLELDVRLSSDGIVMVHHDRLLERTTNLHGPIGARTAGELARADAGWHFRREGEFPFRGFGITVPTLADVLARFTGIRVIIELKDDSPALARAVVAVVRSAGAVERVCLGSFAIGGLRIARSVEPTMATSAARLEVGWALLRAWCRWPAVRVPYAGYQVPKSSGRLRVVSPRFVDAAHRAGLGVQVWTIDTIAEASRLMAQGVDALITDRPDLIVPVVRSHPRAG